MDLLSHSKQKQVKELRENKKYCLLFKVQGSQVPLLQSFLAFLPSSSFLFVLGE